MVIAEHPVENGARLVTGASLAASPIVALDADFDRRWAAWVVKGQVHERRTRRRMGMTASVLAVGGAIAYAFMR